jgi:hypothetical protein
VVGEEVVEFALPKGAGVLVGREAPIAGMDECALRDSIDILAQEATVVGVEVMGVGDRVTEAVLAGTGAWERAAYSGFPS